MNRARRDHGVAEWTMPRTAKSLARPTMTCCHCNDVTIIPEKARAEDCGGFCRMCMAPTCKACADKGCTPFERQLEAMERRGRLMAALGIEG